MLTLGVALIDTAVGVWLVRYAVRRERRDKDGVLFVGIVLLVCALLLVGVELLLVDQPPAGGDPSSTNL